MVLAPAYFANASVINLGDGATYYNGSSGLLNTGAIKNIFGAGGTLSINFNGGTLQASASSGSFITGATAATVQSGGARIDTQSYNVTIAQPLLHDGTLGGSLDGGLTKLGSGELTLAANDTYSGPTTISAGTLQLGNANAVQDSTVLVNSANSLLFATSIGVFNVGGLSGSGATLLADTGGAAIYLNVGGDGQSTTYSGALSGVGNLTKQGGGALVLAGSDTYGGVTTVTAGTLQLGSGSNSGTSNASIGITGSYYSIGSGGTLVVAGTTGGGGSFVALGSAFRGAGTLLLSGNNTISSTNEASQETFALTSSFTGAVAVQNAIGNFSATGFGGATSLQALQGGGCGSQAQARTASPCR